MKGDKENDVAYLFIFLEDNVTDGVFKDDGEEN